MKVLLIMHVLTNLIIKLFFVFEGGLDFVFRVFDVLRKYLFWILTDASQKINLTLQAYQNNPQNGFYATETFDWEMRLFERAEVAGAQRILIGGCGQGREAAYFAQKQKTIVGFDPSEEDIVVAKTNVPQAHFYVSSYQTCQTHVLDQEAPFDVIVLGWGSFSHVTSAHDRQNLLSTLKAHSPHAPIALSFLIASPPTRLERFLHQALQKMFFFIPKAAHPSFQDRFFSNWGFVHFFTQTELEQGCASNGYHKVLYKTHPYGHALWVPQKA